MGIPGVVSFLAFAMLQARLDSHFALCEEFKRGFEVVERLYSLKQAIQVSEAFASSKAKEQLCPPEWFMHGVVRSHEKGRKGKTTEEKTKKEEELRIRPYTVSLCAPPRQRVPKFGYSHVG